MNRVLITGGSGYLGRALARTLLETTSAHVCIYSRGEVTQATMRREFAPIAGERLHYFIGDVRDLERLRRAMTGCDVVIHAAALKRIEVGHYNPMEMIKTNVYGAMNVVEAAMDTKPRKVVGVSSDKAFQPVSPYGNSKALMENLFLNANNMRGADGPAFSVCRYGNVAGSTGSVIPTWRAILASGPNLVPVTDPDATRFWMTIDQAVRLVIDTARPYSDGGELNIPILPAYRLDDLATAMGAQMNVRGMGPWEKRHESMDYGNSSDRARRMSVDEIKTALEGIK